MNSIYQHTFKSINGNNINLSDYQNNILLIVNTASQCGFTHQFKNLQAVFDEFKNQGLVVLGFPSNDFGNQDPGTDDEILEFCQHNFDVSFPIMQKSSLQENPLYKDLIEQTGSAPNWNFTKYLIEPNATSIQVFPRDVDPIYEIRDAIMQMI